jgi:hypothetical protein
MFLNTSIETRGSHSQKIIAISRGKVVHLRINQNIININKRLGYRKSNQAVICRKRYINLLWDSWTSIIQVYIIYF